MRAALSREPFAGGREALGLFARWPGMAGALAMWRDPDEQFCWIERPPVPAIERYLDEATREGVLGRGWHLEWSSQQPLALDLLPLLRGRGALVRDMDDLAALLCQIADARRARVRFDVISVAQCPRFHVDNVKARLLCTYWGSGTQWLDEPDVDRSKLGEGSGGLPDEASGLILRPGAIRTLPTFAIALLKGRLWPANQGRGAIHRSPPVARYVAPRVMVAIDAL